MQFLSHTEVWNTITDLTSRCSVKSAAVAYVSSDIVVKFGQSDFLVTDASDTAVLAGQTSGWLIERAFKRGARIVSVEGLHAKVFLFDNTLLVGSANISTRSRTELIEAALVTDSQEPVAKANQFISRLIEEGVEVDEARIDALVKLEATRPKSSALPESLGDPHIIFFKEINPGDLKKYERSSAASGTGGGARDLRVSPRSLFEPLLQQMISEPGPADGVTHGRVLSLRTDGRFDATEIQLWPPTEARENELRFARIYDVPGWYIPEEEYNRLTNGGSILFYVLEMDAFGTVFAKILSDAQLSTGYPLVAQHLANLIDQRRPPRAIVGAVDLAQQVTVP